MADIKDIRIRLSAPKNVNINLEDPNPLNISFDNRLIVRTVEPDHSKLDNLDYESSGHIGFMPKKLSLLPPLPNESKNKNLRLSLFDSTTEESYVTNLDDFRKRIIKTEGPSYVSTENGQYVFIEINK